MELWMTFVIIVILLAHLTNAMPPEIGPVPDGMGAVLPETGVMPPEIGAVLPGMGVMPLEIGAVLPKMDVVPPEIGAVLPKMDVVPLEIGAVLPEIGAVPPEIGVLYTEKGAVHPGIGTLPPRLGVPASECRSLMDLVLVVDGSDSIANVDYIKQRVAIAGLMKELHLGPKQARVGIVVYSTTIAQVINITYNREDLMKEAGKLIHPRDGTMTSLGISTAKQLFREQGRPHVPWVCIVITDGLSKNPLLTAEEANGAKKMGINMFAVGISHFIQQSELEAIASDAKQILMLKTFDQLRMSLSSLMKVVCPCPPPPPLSYGVYDDGPRSIGSVRQYICEPGYQLIGDSTIECLKDSTWSPLHVTCMACPPPPIEYGFGEILPGPLTLEMTREYKCKKGYTSPEPVVITCLPGGLEGPTWTKPKLVCRGCPPLPTMKNGYFDPPSLDALIGTVINYQCSPGFIETGPLESTCVDNMGIPKWTKPFHTCIACGPPPPVNFADVDTKGSTLVNSIRVYTCMKGYHPTGPIEAVCMGKKGATFWKLTDHSCRACDVPPKIENAILQNAVDTLVGSTLRYVCLKGFQETGPLEVMCKAKHGVTFWDDPGHKCVACIAPPAIHNAILDPMGDTLMGSIRTYKCMDGYIATGPIEVGCIRGTGGPLWTSPVFNCITCLPPPVLPYAILDPKGDNFIGHQRLYNCTKGFVPSKPGPIIIECIGEYLNNKGRAFWSSPSHECRACLNPPPLEFAEVDHGDVYVGTSRRYKCNNGYYATGLIEIKCLGTAEWSLPEHSCTACGPTPAVPNADIIPGPHVLMTVRKYKCHKGFVPDNPPTIECLKGAKWSPVNFKCIGCKIPYKMDHAVLEPGDDFVGSIRRYTCLPGYFGTGTITTTCAVPKGVTIPDWSTPVHYCKDCGEPYLVENATPTQGTRTIGSKQAYMCLDGFVPSGPPVTHCMQNGEWTLPDFKCITCSSPPAIEYAQVDTVGSNLVHSVRAYMCIKGFVATGPIEVKCVMDTADGIPYWMRMTENHCKDCGMPPKLDNAYASIGSTNIGSRRKYSCLDGYDLRGEDKIMCMSSGFWSKPNFTCIVTPVTINTAPVPIQKEPSVCDGCRMLNGVGYINHPFDCTKFVQCFYSSSGGIDAVYMPCPFGQYWDQEDLTCKPADQVECPNERCIDHDLVSYQDSDSTKCCAYWECVNGKSEAKCCSEGSRYVSGKGCEPDPFCEADCPWEDMFPECDKSPLLDITQYEQHAGNGNWIKMRCAPGTAFNIIDCECTLNTGIVPGYVCRPELHLNFDDDDIRDDSGKNVFILNEGVRSYKGAAYFDGHSRILVNRFSNTEFNGHLVIKFRYKEQLEGPTANDIQALVTNGDCGDDPSIILAKMPGYVLLGAKTSKPKSFALPTVEKEWKEVVYIHDERRLEGKVCGASYNKWSQGPIQSTDCGLQIGYGTKLANFIGLMDDNQHHRRLKSCTDKGLLAECMDIIGEMYKVKFDTKDYCIKPMTENTLNGKLIDKY